MIGAPDEDDSDMFVREVLEEGASLDELASLLGGLDAAPPAPAQRQRY